MFDYANNPQDEEEGDENDVGPNETLKTNPTTETVKAFKAPSNGITSTLSQEELDNLKKTNPTKYLKTIMNTRGSSTDKCPSSSTVSGGQPASDPADY